MPFSESHLLFLVAGALDNELFIETSGMSFDTSQTLESCCDLKISILGMGEEGKYFLLFCMIFFFLVKKFYF